MASNKSASSSSSSSAASVADSCSPSICGYPVEAFEKMTIDEKCTACLNVYGAIDVPDELSMDVEAVCHQLEKEIDQLPDKSKAPYQQALEEEIRQHTNYVRNRDLLLMFLRCDHFDVRKAAARMAKYFAYKLDLFGKERLPHPITQADLKPEDTPVLHSGFLHFNCGTDLSGRTVIMSRRKQLSGSGLWCTSQLKSIERVVFYLLMKVIENNVDSQRKGVVCIIWNPDSSLSLKEVRITLPLVIMASQAVPLRGGGLHVCYNEPDERAGALWRYTVLPNHIRRYIKFHAKSTSDSLIELWRYGINVDNLPLGNNGDYEVEKILFALKEQKEMEEKNNPRNKIMKHSKFEPENGNHVRISQEVTREIENSTMESVVGEQNSFVSEKHSSTTAHKSLATSKQCIEPIQKTPATELTDYTSNLVLSQAEASSYSFSPNASSEYKASGIGGSDEKLPVKLMNILQSNLFTDAIWWIQPDGNRFAINKDKFFHEVMPKHFHKTKLDSFLRSLRRWGFERLSAENEMGNVNIYRHSLFQRCAPHLVHNWTLSEGGQPKKEKLPVKLMKLLDRQTATDSIWWLDDGTSFSIDTEKFAKGILSENFKITLDSFIRMMRRWEFKRLPNTKNLNDHTIISYQHPLFQRDAPELLTNWNCLDALTKLGVGGNSSRPREGKFPLRLFKVLENNLARDAICWLPKGDAFALETKKFAQLGRLKEFQAIKFSSFQRSLKRWGFKKRPKQLSTTSIYYHPLFQKGSPELLEIFSNESKENLQEVSSQLGLELTTAAQSAAAAPKPATALNNNDDADSTSIATTTNLKMKPTSKKKLPLKKRFDDIPVAHNTVTSSMSTDYSDQAESQLEEAVVSEECTAMEVDQNDDSSQELPPSPQVQILSNSYISPQSNQNQRPQEQSQILDQQRQQLQTIVQSQASALLAYMQQEEQNNLQLEVARLTQALQSHINQQTAGMPMGFHHTNAHPTMNTEALANIIAGVGTNNNFLNTTTTPSPSNQQLLQALAVAGASTVPSPSIQQLLQALVVACASNSGTDQLQAQLLQAQLQGNQLDLNAVSGCQLTGQQHDLNNDLHTQLLQAQLQVNQLGQYSYSVDQFAGQQNGTNSMFQSQPLQTQMQCDLLDPTSTNEASHSEEITPNIARST